MECKYLSCFNPSLAIRVWAAYFAAKVADAIDHSYLYAEGDAWKRPWPTLLANAAYRSAIDREFGSKGAEMPPTKGPSSC